MDARRLPPGQLINAKRLPVVDVGRPERTDVPANWAVTVWGNVHHKRTVTLSELQTEYRRRVVTADMHCVSRWSQQGIRWEGVETKHLLEQAGPRDGAKYALVTCKGGYTVLLELEDLVRDGCLLAWNMDGSSLPHEHGGPLRLVVPHLYAWKSAKWIRAIHVLRETDLAAIDLKKQTHWEGLGFHLRGDPWQEQRLQDDPPLRPPLLGPLNGKLPSLVILASNWGDGVTRFLADCAHDLIELALQSGRRFHYAGPCSCRPDYVRSLLEAQPGLPIFFFGHGRAPDPRVVQGNYRLLGQPDQRSGKEAVLFEKGKDDDLFRNRLVYAVGCHSSLVIEEKTAHELGITLIGFPSTILVNHPDYWLPGESTVRQRECYLAGAQALLQGQTAEGARDQIEQAFKELTDQRRKQARKHLEGEHFDPVHLLMYSNLKRHTRAPNTVTTDLSSRPAQRPFVSQNVDGEHGVLDPAQEFLAIVLQGCAGQLSRLDG